MTHEEIWYSTKGPVGYQTLNNPEKINSLSKNKIGEIFNAIDEIADASRFVLAIGKQGFYAQLDQPDSNGMHYAKYTVTMNLSAKDAQMGSINFSDAPQAW